MVTGADRVHVASGVVSEELGSGVPTCGTGHWHEGQQQGREFLHSSERRDFMNHESMNHKS
jgi:hypothetical protein